MRKVTTDEYTTAFLYSDWLYILWHRIKYSMLCLLLLTFFCSYSRFSLTTEEQEFWPCPYCAGEI